MTLAHRRRARCALPLAASAVCVVALAGCASSPLEHREPSAWTDPWSDRDRSAPPPRIDYTARHNDPDTVEPADLPENATLADVLAYAQVHSVALRAAQERWKAAAARIDGARFLPDPWVSYRQKQKSSPREQEIMVEQSFPWFGTIERRRDVAARDAEAELARVSEEWLNLRASIVESVMELAYLDEQIALTHDTADLTRQLEASFRAQYTTQPDVYASYVRAQVEVGRIENELASLLARRVPLATRLNAMLSRPSDAPLPTEWGLPDEVIDATDADVFAWLDEHSPALRVRSAVVESLREGQALARVENRPEFRLGLGGDVVEDAYVVAVAMSVPLWNDRNEGRVREATANRIAAAYEREDARHRLRAEASDLLFRHHDAQRRIDLLRSELIPIAEEAMRAVMACCAAGNTGLRDALDAERTLLDLRLEEARAVADRAVTLARLETVCGVPLPRRSDAPPIPDTHEGDER